MTATQITDDIDAELDLLERIGNELRDTPYLPGGTCSEREWRLAIKNSLAENETQIATLRRMRMRVVLSDDDDPPAVSPMFWRGVCSAIARYAAVAAIAAVIHWVLQ